MNARRSTGPLGRDEIVSAALALVDASGPDALSMRRLGAQLGVDPMAIYYHVPDKKAGLVVLIIEAIMAEVDLNAGEAGAPPHERLCQLAGAFRSALLAHGNAAELLVGRNLETPSELRPIEKMLAALLDSGLAPLQALWAVNAVSDYVIGAATMQLRMQRAVAEGKPTVTQASRLPAEEFPALRHVLAVAGVSRFDAQFEFGLEALVSGLLTSTERES
ncbi:MAG TPA: TetR/AcrR family transcriptional regulator C-terminal domain-containing protein [Coriobacteriia bacterium]|nr:TetR/AcrR family transcriptional regulator C-terminal domain-containing protein [Coriobacteriia bacterium]